MKKEEVTASALPSETATPTNSRPIKDGLAVKRLRLFLSVECVAEACAGFCLSYEIVHCHRYQDVIAAG